MNKDYNVGVGTTINEKIATGKIYTENNPVFGMEYTTPTKDLISETMKNLADFLIAKNKNYGNSALKPLKVFNNVEPTNGICVRIDDKLSRIANAKELRKNDLVDLAGYVILLLVQKGFCTFKELID